MNLRELLKPQSLAIIGASEKPGFGGDTTKNLYRYTKNTDRIYLVNPGRDTIFGHKSYHSVSDIDDVVEMVVICTPQKTVIPLLKEAKEKGCKAAVVFASGYSEVGTEGKILQDELMAECEKLDISIMGPNCAGFANFVDEIFLFAFETEERERSGKIGMISQSGQICLSAMDWPCMDFSYLISSGNSSNVKVEDYIEFMVDDEDTEVVIGYVEGINNPETFVRALEKAALKKKPVVLLKTGRSKKSQELANSHTGSLSGSDSAIRAIMRKYGVIQVDDLQSLCAVANMFATIKRMPKDGRFVFMSCSGGESGVAADLADFFNIELADLKPETSAELQAVLPSYATVNNPLDMTAQLGYDTEKLCVTFRALFKDENVDVLSIAYTITEEIFDTTVNYISEAISIVSEDENAKPIIWIPYFEHTRNRENAAILKAAGCPILPSGKGGFEVAKKFSDFISFEYEDIKLKLPEDNQGRETVIYSEYDSGEYLSSKGLKISPQATAETAEDAVKIAEEFGYPIVLKVNSPDIMHKSDVGGVKLNLKNADAVRGAFESIMNSATTKCPDAKINGVLVKPMLEAGLEFIIGVNNDPQFGPMIMVGLGGVFVEIFKDVQLAPVPLSKAQARSMIKQLKGYKLLDGYRGGKKYDIEALIDFIVNIGDIAAAQKNEIKELDINPLFVNEKGVEMADALLVTYK
jgi:acyl-CoA synthetase (NDP forming)